METAQAEDGDIYALLDSGYSTVLTNSMLNCRKVEEHVISTMQAESGVQMASTHKCRKTHYVKSRDDNICAIESDALNVPLLKQDLNEGRTDTNGLNSQVILDKNTDIRRIYPRIDSKLYGDEQFIPFISDDSRMFRTKAPHPANAAEVSSHPLKDTTSGWFYSRRQKKRRSHGGYRDGQDRRNHSAAIINHTSYAYTQDGRSVAIIRHIGASMGYDKYDKHFTGFATIMDFQPASITKTGEASLRASAAICPALYHATGEASLRAPAAICPALYNATGRAVPRTAATSCPAQNYVAGEVALRATANIPVQYNATGEAGQHAKVDKEPVSYQAVEEDRFYVHAGTRGRSMVNASLEQAKAGIAGSTNIPVQYNETGEAGQCAKADKEPVSYQTVEEDRFYVHAGTRGRSMVNASLEQAKAGTRRPSLLTGDGEDPHDSIDAWTLPNQETTLENSRDGKTGTEAPRITTSGTGSDNDESDYESSLDGKEGTSNPMIPTYGAGGDGNEPPDEHDDYKLVTSTATEQATARELVTTANEPVTSTTMEQVTTADGLVTATTFPDAVPDPEDETQGMCTAPIMGTSSVVLNDRVSSGSLGCQSTTTADCMDAARLPQPLPERNGHVGGQEGGTKGAPIVDLNTDPEACKIVQFDEEVSMRIACPCTKSMELLPGCGRVLIETPSGFKIIASEPQMDGRTTIISLGKLYECYDTSQPGKQLGECVPCYEEHHAMREITDYCVPDLNMSGMVKTSVGALLSIPFADVQVWTRGLELTNDGTVFPSEVLPPPSTAGRVARVIPPRLSSSAQEPTNGGTVCPSEVLPPAFTTGRVARVIPPRLSPSASEHMSTTTPAVEDRAALHAPCCSGGGFAAQEGDMPYIVIRPLVIHLVGIACTTELQKLEHLIYMETGAQRIFAGHIHAEGEEDLPLGADTSTLSWTGKRQLYKARKRPTL